MVAAISIDTAAAPAPTLVLERDPERHRPFVFSSWVKSYVPLMPAYAKTYGMSRWAWVDHCAHRLIGRGAVLLGAYVEGYPDAMLGFICGEPGTLHYIYVASDTRRHGLAGELLANLLPIIGQVRRITHRPGTGRGNLRAKAHDLGWRYEPLTREELER